MRDGYLRGSLSRTPTARQVDVLAAFVATGGSVPNAAARVGVGGEPGPHLTTVSHVQNGHAIR